MPGLAREAADVRPAATFDLLAGVSGEALSEDQAHAFDGVGLVRGEYLCRSANAYVTLGRWHDAATTYLDALCALFAPKPVRYRLVDMETSELNRLPGVDEILAEKTTMLGLRGARRAIRLPAALRSEAAMLAALRRKHSNLEAIISFVGDHHEAVAVRGELERAGFGGPVGVMLEIPAALIGVRSFVSAGFDHLVIGLNDLSSLCLGKQREACRDGMRHPAVQRLIEQARAEAPDATMVLAGYFDAAAAADARRIGLDGIVANVSLLRRLGLDSLQPATTLDFVGLMNRVRTSVGDPVVG